MANALLCFHSMSDSQIPIYLNQFLRAHVDCIYSWIVANVLFRMKIFVLAVVLTTANSTTARATINYQPLAKRKS